MNRLVRYATLWRALPDDERRARAGRVLERLFRRGSTVRRLGLVGDQPSWRSLERALSEERSSVVRALRSPDHSRGPLDADLGSRAAFVAARHSDHADVMLASARDLLRRRFDLLGSGPTRPLDGNGAIDWHQDFKSGVRWDPDTFYLDVPIVRGDGSDIKIPWELSRFQHLAVLGQAYRLASHRLAAEEADALRAACAAEAAAQIEDWIARNPRGLGVNWACTMDVAIRAFNWIAALAFFRDAPEWDDGFVQNLIRSLWVHGRHIRRNLEIGGDGLTSNHYLSDIVGLYAIACTLPWLREAAPWRRLAHRALLEEIDRQVLADGVDFERSIPYHRLVTELFIHGALLARCVGDPLPGTAIERLGRMLEFTAVYTRPDGSAPQWGDNDDGRLLPLDGYAAHFPHDHRHVLDLGARVLDRHDLIPAAPGCDVEASWLLPCDLAVPKTSGVATAGSRGFETAGYYVLRDADLHLGVPCGAVGTRGIGNHTHNDLFSLCLWAGGREWITDPGTGCYTSDPKLRNLLRSTVAHATVQLGDREQNGIGAGVHDLFLVEERARPEVLEWEVGREETLLTARHRGFGDATHTREIRFCPALRAWTVRDRLEHTGPASDESIHVRLPLSPGVSVLDANAGESAPRSFHAAIDAHARVDRDRRVLALDGGEGRRLWVGFVLPQGSAADTTTGVFSPRYGVTHESRVIVATAPPGRSVEIVTVIAAPGTS